MNSAKAEVDFMRVTGGTGSGFIENTGRRPMLKSVGGEDAANRIDESPRLRSLSGVCAPNLIQTSR